jgi:hypothetical protein
MMILRRMFGERDDGNGGEGEGVLGFLRQLLRKM